ncbi:4'-phosphopantetheinyl transferase family protein [Streptomyces endophyticus]|uniref:4'-phosphopantetheinyl transferase superfamily protein n=1 Tax=Streptomyces endophyticus TaxID=714166 RepID=A0ABU6F0K2_9ACTN|nr:4'-phosphopantetheinyl transferase superfamily protein [Streptomyces endophyticus]MEB8337514.1 4'-phosphopantetheinyl transferase superfamily protein [Streptomyces endophyticus]
MRELLGGHRQAPPDPPPATALLSLGLRETHIWTLRVPGPGQEPPSHVLAELDRRERHRASGFLRPRDRLRYVAAHVVLRRVLALYLGLEPGAVRFGRADCPRCRGPHGRPEVRDAEGAPHFSLSHSGDLAMVAVAREPVGVDVQTVPSLETMELCGHRLHPQEWAEMSELPAGERALAFARVWARKEAYLKGLGFGLARRLDADYLGGRGRLAGAVGEWLVRDLGEAGEGAAARDAVAAVAVRTRHDHRVTQRTVPVRAVYGSDAEGADLMAATAPFRSVDFGTSEWSA